MTQTKQVKSRIDLYHNSNRDEDHIECKQLWLKLNDTYRLNMQKTENIYIMIITEMKRVILKKNKYHKQLYLQLNDIYNLNKQKTKYINIMIVIEMKRVILKVNKYHKQL